jgi:hypothetical protein
VSAMTGEDGTLGTVYYVKMEDAHNIITVKMDTDGNASVTEKFRKAL